jgi:hypothetical protein
MSRAMSTNRRRSLRTHRVLRATALFVAIGLLAGIGPLSAAAQTSGGTPGAVGATAAGGQPGAGSHASGSGPSNSGPAASSPSSTVHQMSPEMVERMQREMFDKRLDSRLKPESPESISRKLQSGEYTIDRNEKPAWYWIVKLGLLIFTVSMLIVSLLVRLTTKKPQPGEIAADEVRRADALAETARGKYRNLVRGANRKNFVERRSALAAEGAAVEKLLRQSADQYRAASEKFAQPAELNTPATARTRLLAEACVQRAASQTALADVAALLGDSKVTSPEEFTRRAEPLSAAANAAAEMSRQLMKQAGGGG